MQLTITLINKENDESIDLTVNEDQKIEDTLRILRENGMFNTSDGNYSLRSQRFGISIEKEKTFKQARIYQGDILEAATVS